MELTFRNERAILTLIANLTVRVKALETENGTLKGRVKTLEDRGGSTDTTIHSKLDLLLHQQGMLLQQGENLMATAQDLSNILDEIDVTTTAMAADLTRQSASITEIDADIDALLTRAPGEPISEALKARFETHRNTLRSMQTDLNAKAGQLEATAAKHPVPDTPPVEEPPVDQPPTEEPPIENPPTPA